MLQKQSLQRAAGVRAYTWRGVQLCKEGFKKLVCGAAGGGRSGSSETGGSLQFLARLTRTSHSSAREKGSPECATSTISFETFQLHSLFECIDPNCKYRRGTLSAPCTKRT